MQIFSRTIVFVFEENVLHWGWIFRTDFHLKQSNLSNWFFQKVSAVNFQELLKIHIFPPNTKHQSSLDTKTLVYLSNWSLNVSLNDLSSIKCLNYNSIKTLILIILLIIQQFRHMRGTSWRWVSKKSIITWWLSLKSLQQ